MTREEIIKELRCLASGEDCPSEKCDNTCPYWTEREWWAALYEDRQLCRAAADLLEQDAKTGWISVKDRLPEYGRYLVTVAKDDGDVIAHTAAYNDLGWWMHSNVGKITHWMPLPEPPKEEEK